MSSVEREKQERISKKINKFISEMIAEGAYASWHTQTSSLPDEENLIGVIALEKRRESIK